MRDLRDKHIRYGIIVILAVLAATFVACGDDDGDDGGGAATTVDITLQEWAVVPSTTEVDAGSITFEITNEGSETHEFVVIGTDVSAADLPVGADGSVEEGGALEVIDEVEDLATGASETLTVDLEAGHYVLFCNILEEEDGEAESHYQMGMRVDFEVR